MTLTKNGISVTLNQDNGEISSIKFFDKEILYQGNQTWKKTYPICFPNLSFSRKYRYDMKPYNLPKHGFWKHLDWTLKMGKMKRFMVATSRINHPNYPFQLDIEHRISIGHDFVSQQITITNIGFKEAYFHFGLHPAFKTAPESFLFFSTDHSAFWIDKQGKLTKQEVDLNENVKIKKLDFKNPKNDTIFIEEWKRGSVAIENDDYGVFLSFKSNHMQIWKNPADNFICVEPWWGIQDDLYEYIGDVTKKRDIIHIKPHKKFMAKLKIRVYDNAPKRDIYIETKPK